MYALQTLLCAYYFHIRIKINKLVKFRKINARKNVFIQCFS